VFAADAPVLMPHIKGQDQKRWVLHPDAGNPMLPDVPTLAEQGYADPPSTMVRLLAPANTPPAVISKIHAPFCPRP